LRFKAIPCAYVEERKVALRKSRRDYYRRHPLRLLADYRNRPLAALKAVLRTARMGHSDANGAA
jgi:hypothetical protein